MVEKKEGSSRRVYSLPEELVERINEFQLERGFSSEVEAVRRLLDDALKIRDTPEKLIIRSLEKMKSVKSVEDVARDVLVGHPLITDISFEDENIQFWIRGAGHYKLSSKSELFYDEIDSGDSWIRIDDPIILSEKITERKSRLSNK